MLHIPLTTIEYKLKEGTKTVWVEVSREVKTVTETEYNNIIESTPFMRRLGGSEHLSRTYTKRGYKVHELTSKNPSKTVKVVRTFDWGNSTHKN